MKFTVVWHDEALAALGDIWLKASDRTAITEAAFEIDRLLKFSPRQIGRPVGDKLGALRVRPLEILFRVSDADRLVEVVFVKTVRPEWN